MVDFAWQGEVVDAGADAIGEANRADKAILLFEKFDELIVGDTLNLERNKTGGGRGRIETVDIR